MLTALYLVPATVILCKGVPVFVTHNPLHRVSATRPFISPPYLIWPGSCIFPIIYGIFVVPGGGGANLHFTPRFIYIGCHFQWVKVAPPPIKKLLVLSSCCRTFSIAVNDFHAKKSAWSCWALVATELALSGTQCKTSQRPSVMNVTISIEQDMQVPQRVPLTAQPKKAFSKYSSCYLFRCSFLYFRVKHELSRERLWPGYCWQLWKCRTSTGEGK